MAGDNDKITKVEVGDEFRICPACGYKDGFHATFKAQGNGKPLKLILLCPQCSARYDIGKTL